MMSRKVHCATAMFAGFGIEEAVKRCHSGVTEAYGVASTEHIQICPQSHGYLDQSMCMELTRQYPGTKFRLHANVRVMRERCPYDASDSGEAVDHYFRRMAWVNRVFGSQPYTLHAGERKHCRLDGMANNVRRISDILGTRVGVEGLYPSRGDRFLLSSWAEYRWLLESGLDFAIDLSHLQIVAFRERRIEMGLASELVASERCLELHLSDNDLTRDSHRVLVSLEKWWWPLTEHAHPDAVLFSEGLQEMKRPASKAA